MDITIDQRAFAAFLLAGQSISLIGGLYLAYDLFGGPKGPLRRLTAVFTYILLPLIVSLAGYLALYLVITTYSPDVASSIGHNTLLGGLLGLGLGIGFGAGLGYALNAHHQFRYKYRTRWQRVRNGALVGLEIGIFGCGFYVLAAFAAQRHPPFLNALLEAAAYSIVNGFIATTLIARLLVRRLPKAEEGRIPNLDKEGAIVGLLAGYILGLVNGVGYWVAYHPGLVSGVLNALAGAVVGGIGGGMFLGYIQHIEWRVANLPERRLGLFGSFLIFVGFAMESTQYLVPLLNIKVR
jgi:hypothetical protein